MDFSHCRAFALASGLLLASAHGIAFAQAPAAPQEQSMGDLRQEIARLKQLSDEQAAELEAALARIKELEQQLADADDAAKAKSAGGAAAPAAPAPAPTPADPAIGPGGLLASLRADYLAAFPTVPSPNGADGARATQQHLNALQSWVTKSNREGVRALAWTGRIDPNSVRRVRNKVNFTLVFEEPNGTRDWRVPAQVTEGAFARVMRGDVPETGMVTVNARVSPRMRVNPSRTAPGAFDVPPSVGPYLEFGYDLDVRSMVPAQQADPNATVPTK
jgi:hypothetical protein